MANAVIVDAIRTPMGRRNGVLRHWHAVDLVAELLGVLIERTGLDPAAVDDVIMGCVMQVGEQAVNVSRNSVLAAGWPESVPGTTIDRQCGSGQQAVHFAAQGVMCGAYDVVVAGGVETMTRVPMGASMADGQHGYPFGPRMNSRYSADGGLVAQGVAAELVAQRWQISRAEMDAYGAQSQHRAARAYTEGRFDDELIPVDGAHGLVVARDEGVRDTELDVLSRLQTSFVAEEDGGSVTAGNSSQVSDGAAAVLVMSEDRAFELGLRPRARFVDFAVAGDDPRLMLTAHIAATQQVVKRSGVGLGEIDCFEVNEAFASAVLAWEHECQVDMARVNVNGGAIALGHPLGATGARMTATLVNELERSGGRYGLQTICEGGGLGNAMIIERCTP